MRAHPPPRIVILRGRKRSMCEKTSQNKWGLSRRISCHTCETIHSPLIKGMTGDWETLQAFPAWGRGTASAVDRVLSLAAQMRPFSPSFLWKEVPRRGGGWPRETLLPYSGKPTPPRFARLPLPEEGARMIFKETLIILLSFAVRDSRFPLICRALLRFPHPERRETSDVR